MSTDPVAALIAAGAIPDEPFAPESRYRGVPIGRWTRGPDDPGIAYVLRRFIPQQRHIPTMSEHSVQAGERPDLLAARFLGGAGFQWRIADANAVTDPFELTDTLGLRIVIPAPAGQ